MLLGHRLGRSWRVVIAHLIKLMSRSFRNLRVVAIILMIWMSSLRYARMRILWPNYKSNSNKAKQKINRKIRIIWLIINILKILLKREFNQKNQKDRGNHH